MNTRYWGTTSGSSLRKRNTWSGSSGCTHRIAFHTSYGSNRSRYTIRDCDPERSDLDTDKAGSKSHPEQQMEFSEAVAVASSGFHNLDAHGCGVPEEACVANALHCRASYGSDQRAAGDAAADGDSDQRAAGDAAAGDGSDQRAAGDAAADDGSDQRAAGDAAAGDGSDQRAAGDAAADDDSDQRAAATWASDEVD